VSTITDGDQVPSEDKDDRVRREMAGDEAEEGEDDEDEGKIKTVHSSLPALSTDLQIPLPVAVPRARPVRTAEPAQPRHWKPDSPQRQPDNRQWRPDNRQWRPNNRQWRPDNRQWRPDNRQWRPDNRQWRPDNRQWRPDNRQTGPESTMQCWSCSEQGHLKGNYIRTQASVFPTLGGISMIGHECGQGCHVKRYGPDRFGQY